MENSETIPSSSRDEGVNTPSSYSYFFSPFYEPENFLTGMAIAL